MWVHCRPQAIAQGPLYPWIPGTPRAPSTPTHPAVQSNGQGGFQSRGAPTKRPGPALSLPHPPTFPGPHSPGPTTSALSLEGKLLRPLQGLCPAPTHKCMYPPLPLVQAPHCPSTTWGGYLRLGGIPSFSVVSKDRAGATPLPLIGGDWTRTRHDDQVSDGCTCHVDLGQWTPVGSLQEAGRPRLRITASHCGIAPEPRAQNSRKGKERETDVRSTP